MFRPNLECTVSRMTGPRDVYGNPSVGSVFSTKCGIVRLEDAAVQSSVRVDSSASRGTAWENSAVARLLFKAPITIEAGDKVEVSGMTLMVLSVFPRHHVTGILDHYQVDCRIWALES